MSVLVADDFGSFRNIVNGMLINLGVNNISLASSAQEVIDLCIERQFDVILCDYNIGEGRTGQHVLEEIRHKKYITRQTIFIIVSAEASRNIVMSAYDCEPDDYLMKPITAQMLGQRMARLLVQRHVFRPIYSALEANNDTAAIELLTDISLDETRHSIMAQKMLGELFIQKGAFKKAEKLYTKALEIRQLDWARLGLAKVKLHIGDAHIAGAWLDRIIEDNPLFLPAYDVLAQNWAARGDSELAQQTIERAVDVSPMSILRQKKLASLAVDNKDFTTAIKAYRNAIQLGKLSCHGGAEDGLAFANTVLLASQSDNDLSPALLQEAVQSLEQVQEYYDLDNDLLARTHIMASRLYSAQGNTALAEDRLCTADMAMQRHGLGVDVELDRVGAILEMGDTTKADVLLQQLLQVYSDDQSALEKLDVMLNEPVSQANLELVAKVNRDGISLYGQGDFDDAIACFDQARQLFPRHIGLLLNITQALLGKLKLDANDYTLMQECEETLEAVAYVIDEDHDQFSRYIRLKDMAEVLQRKKRDE